MATKWTLKWGVWRNGNELTREQGTDSLHDSLDECRAEVKRLAKHYKKLKLALWFANAKCTDGEESINLHMR